MDITILSKKGLIPSELSERLEKRNLSICFYCGDILSNTELKEVSIGNMLIKCCEKGYKKRYAI